MTAHIPIRRLAASISSVHLDFLPKNSILHAPSLLRTPTVEPTLICNELDMNGEMHVSSSKFLKSALCATHGVQPRDLRKLDGTLKDQLPVILVRSSAILVNLEYLKAIIRHNGLVLFESVDAKERGCQREFLLDVQSRLKAVCGHDWSAAQPFELQILELMLQRTIQILQDDLDLLEKKIEAALEAIECVVHWERLKVLLECKKDVSRFHERINGIRKAIAEVLESDADMANMYLTAKAGRLHRSVCAHEEVELLLESYLKIAEEMASRVQVLICAMQSTEDIINIALVGQRNELLLLELKLGIGTFAASMGGFGAGLLGMNLENSWETVPYAFYTAAGALAAVSVGAFLLSWRKMLALVKSRYK